MQCKFVDGDIGRCIASLKIEEEHTNKFGTLHGGLSAVIVDTVSTMALALPDEPFSFGVSVDMNLTYMKAAKVGDEVLIDAKVIRRGRSLAFLEVELRNKATNDLLVKGSHTKFLG